MKLALLAINHSIRDYNGFPTVVTQTPRPTELRYDKEEKVLNVEFDDGKIFSFPAEFLRVESPSAEIQGHSPTQKQIIGGRRYIGIMAIEPVGNYAVRIRFDDLHDTGIYSWETLYDYGQRQYEMWQRYLQALEAKGLSRDP